MLRDFVRRYIRKEWKSLTILVGLIFLGTVFENFSPYLYGKMLDAIVGADLRALTGLILFYALMSILTQLLSMVEGYRGQKVSFEISNDVRRDLFWHLVTMKHRHYCTYDTGELMNRLNGDAEGIVGFCLDIITGIIQIIIEISVSLYFILTMSLKLSTVALFYIPMSFLLTMGMRKYYKALAERQKEFGDRYYSFQNRVFSNNEGIKSFMLEKNVFAELECFLRQQFNLLRESIRLNNVKRLLGFLIQLVSSLAIIYISAVLIGKGWITIGVMVSFNTYMNKLFGSISQLFSFRLSKETVDVSLDRVRELTEAETEEIVFGSCALEGKKLCMHQVSFSYEPDQPVLRQCSLTLEKTGLYGFVGQNGCGKSTAAKVLANFYTDYEGDVTIDGISYRTLTPWDIRSKITYVQKEEFFYNDTLRNNLIFGDSRISDRKLEEACREVGMLEFVRQLPEGFDTSIGEDGQIFSSGQKQKLSIARALLRSTPIYIFDELTANLDGGAEKEIMGLLKKLSMHHMILFINHKPSVSEFCDKIFVMEEGKVADVGSHEELLRRNEMYRTMFQRSTYESRTLRENYFE